MILACPFCQSRFLVSASHFASGPRQVQCARCRHSWRAEMTELSEPSAAEPVMVQAPITPPRPPLVTLEDIKQYIQNAQDLVARLLKKWDSLTPKQQHHAKNGSGIFAIFLIISIFIFDSSGIADRWPFMDRVYGLLHLHVDHNHGGDGLAFEHMRSELRYEAGVMNLCVDGKIHNKSGKTQEIPPLLANALGADGMAIESWQIDAPAAMVAADEEVAFASCISAPRGTAVNVNVSFVENKNAAD